MQKLNPSDQTWSIDSAAGWGWTVVAIGLPGFWAQSVLATVMIQPTLSLRFKPSETAEQIFRAPNLPFLLQGRGDNA